MTNLTNRTALYNFQSVFVGTRLVQPRTLGAGDATLLEQGPRIS